MRFLFKLILALVMAVLAFELAVCADTVDGVQAIVGDSVITRQQIQLELFRNQGALEAEYRNRPDELRKQQAKMFNDILEHMVDEKMILHEFETAGFKIPESIIEEFVQERIHDAYHGDRVELTKNLEKEGMTYEDLRKRWREDFIITQMRLKFVPDPIISPLKVETYYINHKDDFKVEDEVKLRMIVLNKVTDDTNGAVRRRMEEIISQVKDGATFGDLAKSYSEGSQRTEGGEMGWQETSKLNKVIVDGVANLKAGEISGVLESDQAYFLALLEERRPARIRPLSELRAEIERNLIGQEKARLWGRWINRLKRKTFIQGF